MAFKSKLIRPAAGRGVSYKNAFLMLLFSYVMPGLGDLYGGRRTKFVTFVLADAIGIGVFATGHGMLTYCVVWLAGLASAWDSVWEARAR